MRPAYISPLPLSVSGPHSAAPPTWASKLRPGHQPTILCAVPSRISHVKPSYLFSRSEPAPPKPRCRTPRAGAAPAPRRRQGGSASRRARSAARLRDYVDAKKVHEKRRLTLLRLDLLVHPLDGDELRLPAQAAQTCLARERHLCEQPRLGQVANRRVEHPVPSRVLEGATAGQHRPDPGPARRLAAASPVFRTHVIICDRDPALGGAWAALRARYRSRDARESEQSMANCVCNMPLASRSGSSVAIKYRPGPTLRSVNAS